MADESITEGLKNLLGGEKSARPSSVGPHHPNADQQDPDAKGLKPADYRPKPGENNNRTDAKAPSGNVNIPVKGGAPASDPDEAIPETSKATGQGKRDAPSQPQD